MKKKIKYLAVILAFVIMMVNTLPGTAVRVNASDLESVSEDSIAALLSENGEDGGDSTVPGQGTSTETGIENETGKWSVKVSYDFAGATSSSFTNISSEPLPPAKS